MFALSSIINLPPRPSVAKFARAHRVSLLKAATGMILLILLPFHAANAASRLKDVVNFEGVRDNMLVGYGLVVGLNGTGDSLTNAPFTERSLIGMLERLGINSSGDFTTIKTKNIAAVMVTATLPPFSSQGSRIDVVVSTMGDAKCLQGGTLLVTPLQGADGEVYAVAQGSVSSGFSASGASGIPCLRKPAIVPATRASECALQDVGPSHATRLWPREAKRSAARSPPW